MPVKAGPTLYVHRPRDWRAWLRRNHATADQIWLVYYRKSSGRPRLAYNDAVDQALCYGWIDSVTRKIDDQCWVQRFTPRRKGSRLSEMNRARVRRLLREKQMTRAGIRALEGSLGDGSAILHGRLREARRWRVPRDILDQIRKEPEAWKRFQRLPAAYKRIRIGFIEGARGRPAEFRRRLRYFIRMTALNRRFGMVRE